MSEQSKFYLDNAERLIGKEKADELKRLLVRQNRDPMFTRAEEERLRDLVFELVA